MLDTNSSARRQAAMLSFALVVASGAAAYAQQPTVGDGSAALPAIHRIGVIDPGGHRLTLAGSTAYGFTEGVLTGQDSHHRFVGVLAASYQPIPWLAVGALGEFRYDHHLGPPDDGDSGWIIEPRFRVRGGYAFPFGLRLGAEAILWVPAADSQSSLSDGLSADLFALAAYAVPDTALIIALHGGYRIDRSGGGAQNAAALSPSDRLALGVSDFQAVPIGLGATYGIGPAELLLEWTWDILLGDGAPEPGVWPMRVAVGARYQAIDDLYLSLIAEVSASGRPEVLETAPLVAVEPRVAIMIGAAYRLSFGEDLSGPAPVPTGAVTVTVSSVAGAPVSGARVTLGQGESLHEGISDGEGAFSLEEMVVGEHQVVVSAEGFAEHSGSVVVSAEAGALAEVALAPLPGELGGQILAPNDAPIRAARVVVTGEGFSRELEVDRQGRFEVTDLEPGTYTVAASAEAFIDGSTEAEVTPGARAEARIALDRAFPAGQLGGIIRAVDGSPLQAMIRISPLGRDLHTDEEGEFEVDVPPGRYRVYVSADGFAMQRRRVVIEENGVTMINVDLRPERRRRRRRR